MTKNCTRQSDRVVTKDEEQGKTETFYLLSSPSRILFSAKRSAASAAAPTNKPARQAGRNARGVWGRAPSRKGSGKAAADSDYLPTKKPGVKPGFLWR